MPTFITSIMHVNVYVFMRMYVCMYVCMHACMYVMYVCLYCRCHLHNEVEEAELCCASCLLDIGGVKLLDD